VASPMRSSSSSLPPSQIPLFEVEPMPDFGTQGPVEREALRSVRRKIAKRMVTSMVVVPHVCHMEEIDITELDKVRREINGRLAAGQPKLTMMAFVLKALIPALRQFPMFNASLDTEREEIVYKKYFNLGFATDTEKGLVVPVIHAAADKSVSQLAEAIRSLSGKARDGKLEVQEMRGGTFTVTNIGALGGVAMVPTINYPETAILGMARVQEKPVVRDGAIVVRTMLPVTLAFDHRVADGADAARFVNELARRLSNSQVFLTET
jgi:pyruvate dehydrogenase E2 component (dihydrolipoamide acetyltransferase)